ncbi:MAG: hypothetical protein E6R04_04730 [Spirochaetes bacterium]|nr:MAG: hypothetical protein E6R04_04730 [Spirochaetota bacterium]
MANTNDPRGFLPYKAGGKEVVAHYYAKTAGEVLYPGDLVKRVAAGTVQVAGAGIAAGIVGVCAAYSAAADTADVPVYDDPAGLFLGQCDGTTAYAVADNGQNVDVAAGTPDTSLRQSGMLIDMNTKNTTATLPFKIMGLAPGVNGGENAAGVNALLILKLNASESHPGSTGV